MYSFENFDEELEYVLQLLNAHGHANSEQAQNRIIDLISDWFDENAVYIGQLDKHLYGEINRILDDGVITDEEYDTLTHYIIEYLDSHTHFDFEAYKKGKQRLTREDIKNITPYTVGDKDFIDNVVVITGTFERFPKRKEAEVEIRRRGGKTSQSISNATTMLICGTGAGWAKIEQVKQRNLQGQNIRLIDEETFYKMLESNEAIND